MNKLTWLMITAFFLTAIPKAVHAEDVPTAPVNPVEDSYQSAQEEESIADIKKQETENGIKEDKKTLKKTSFFRHPIGSVTHSIGLNNSGDFKDRSAVKADLKAKKKDLKAEKKEVKIAKLIQGLHDQGATVSQTYFMNHTSVHVDGLAKLQKELDALDAKLKNPKLTEKKTRKLLEEKAQLKQDVTDVNNWIVKYQSALKDMMKTPSGAEAGQNSQVNTDIAAEKSTKNTSAPDTFKNINEEVFAKYARDMGPEF